MRTPAGGKRRLRRWLLVFFVALAIPSAVLTWQAYSRLQWENFHRYQLLAEELRGRIDARLAETVAREGRRSFEEYSFLLDAGTSPGRIPTRSPLAVYPPGGDIPGLVGYFQVDAEGRFTTPLLPSDAGQDAARHGIVGKELRQRVALRERLLQILSLQAPSVAEAAPVERPARQDDEAAGIAVNEELAADADRAPAAVASAVSPPLRREASSGGGIEPRAKEEKRLAQATFDRLSEAEPRKRKAADLKSSRNIGRVDDLRLEQVFIDRQRESAEFASRAKPAAVPAPAELEADIAPGSAPAVVGGDAPALVGIFENDIDPFEFSLVGDSHLVLYREVWRAGQRFIQGVVIERSAWLREVVESRFGATTLAGMSRLGIVFDGEILAGLGGQGGRSYLSRGDELSGTLLYRARLSSPFDRLELLFSVTQMPTGSGGRLVLWVALTLALVLSAGLLMIYRLGARQLELNQQQRDFVSAVSHELKTPLTSIRMYSEMLREGWADEARRSEYYGFIHDESERLSRLITNVLQLARMNRDELTVELHAVTVGELLELLRSKVGTQVEQAGFTLRNDAAGDILAVPVMVDEDAFAQVMINLVDNALKFSAKAAQRLLIVDARVRDRNQVEFSVRDHGPGVPRRQMRRIFRLFYRPENELTRETVGTGIGLALVHRLARAMGGDVDVVNREPGAEFRVRLVRA